MKNHYLEGLERFLDYSDPGNVEEESYLIDMYDQTLEAHLLRLKDAWDDLKRSIKSLFK